MVTLIMAAFTAMAGYSAFEDLHKLVKSQPEHGIQLVERLVGATGTLVSVVLIDLRLLWDVRRHRRG